VTFETAQAAGYWDLHAYLAVWLIIGGLIVTMVAVIIGGQGRSDEPVAAIAEEGYGTNVHDLEPLRDMEPGKGRQTAVLSSSTHGSANTTPDWSR
jgi:hypothetical protein